MSFNSLQFAVFFPVVVVVYFICPYRYRWALLLVASYYFYAAWAPEYCVWIVLSTLIDYVLAIWIAKAAAPASRKGLLALSLLSNLGLLFVFKYFNFVNNSLRALFNEFNVLYNVPAFQALLPVGISFYTFQTLSYTIDVYRGKVVPERHLGIFALYVSFFPQLVAGPIERAGHLLHQFHIDRKFNASRMADGLRLMLWGMFQKVVVADRLAVYVDAVYNHPTDHRGWPVILATYFCAVQIFCDFSGYSDIAVGAGRVMGYDLTQNFRQPYCAPSVAEFWRRWHISLTSWFRDYLYIPLGGNRVPRWRWYANLMIVFLVSGLWHGASWTFVLWGALHGFYCLLEDWVARIGAKVGQVLHVEKKPAVLMVISTIVTVNLVCFAWIFFRANSVSDAFLLVNNLTQLGISTDVQTPWTGSVNDPSLEMAFTLGLVALLAIVHIVRNQMVRDRASRVSFAIERRTWVRWVVYLLLALAVINLGVTKETPFIYFQF